MFQRQRLKTQLHWIWSESNLSILCIIIWTQTGTVAHAHTHAWQFWAMFKCSNFSKLVNAFEIGFVCLLFPFVYVWLPVLCHLICFFFSLFFGERVLEQRVQTLQQAISCEQGKKQTKHLPYLTDVHWVNPKFRFNFILFLEETINQKLNEWVHSTK